MSKKDSKTKKENTKEKSEEKILDIDIENNEAEDLQKEKDKFLRLFAEFENYKKKNYQRKN